MTNTDVIRELEKKASTLEERLDNARSEIKRVDAERSKLAECLADIDRKLAVIQENVKELKRISEENDRRRWTIILAVVGCFLTFVANLALIYFKSGR